LTARVAIVTSNDWYFMAHRLRIARAVLAKGYDVTVIAAEEHGYGGRIGAEGFRFVPVPVVRGSLNLVKEAATLLALRRIYRQVRPDLLHHVSLKPVIYGSIAARLAGVPAVINAVTGQGYMSGAAGLKGSIIRMAARTAFVAAFSARHTRVIFENPDDLNAFVTNRLIDRERAVLIRGSGVDTQRFTPSEQPPGTPVVLFAARLLWSKGLGVLVDAVKSLRARGAQLRLVIVGVPDAQNPDSIPVEVLKGWVAEGVAEWWGQRDDMPKVFHAANIVALPSAYGEGVPVALIEAAASGRAIVTTDTPGCREIVRDGVNGRLVPKNDVASLASALGELVDSAALRERMGAAGRARVMDEFADSIVVSSTMRVYDELLRRTGKVAHAA
jgi:glycosyltransferase involved in cell wall biosynthesis